MLEFVFGAVSTLKEYGLSFSPGGDQVHFTRGPAFFKSVKRNHNWSEPEQVRFTEQYDNWDPFISPDGSKLYFMSNRPITGIEARMETDIWVIEREHNGWPEPSNLGPVVNSAMTEKDLQASQKMVRCISFSIHLFDFEKDV